jgi:excisionase family DNA binding protein
VKFMANLTHASRLVGAAPPTNEESRVAHDSSRVLAAMLEELSVHKGGGAGTAAVVELRLQVDGVALKRKLSLPAEALRALGRILEEMAEGNAVLLTPIQPELTTNQAANLANVSRPFMCKLLDSGEIAHRKVGRNRRVPYRELLKYIEANHARSKAARDELAAEAQELNMGY